MAGLAIAFLSIVFLSTGFVLADADTMCSFTMNPKQSIMALDGNCTTDETIGIPNGYTLDGQGYTITAIDPAGGHFLGAIIKNEGSVAHVQNLNLRALGLQDVCDTGENRLRGILFDRASGSIKNNDIRFINQGLSSCEEGVAIEVRNLAVGELRAHIRTVDISENIIYNYQKSGIVVNGVMYANIMSNKISSSNSNVFFIAANAIQMGFGAQGNINDNIIEGNQWDVISSPQWSATAILIYEAENIKIRGNSFSGEGTDIGIAAYNSGQVSVKSNKIFRSPPVPLLDVIDAYGIGLNIYNNQRISIADNYYGGWRNNFIEGNNGMPRPYLS